MDTLIQVFALISAAMPVLTFMPQVRIFLFGNIVDGRRVAPTPIAQVILVLMGGLFCSGLTMLYLWANILSFVTVELGPEQMVSGQNGAFVIGNGAYCKTGKIIGVSCRVKWGGGNLQNQAIGADSGECSWRQVENNFQASVRAICMRGGSR